MKAIERMRAGETWILRYLKEKEEQRSKNHALTEASVSAFVPSNQLQASMGLTGASHSKPQSSLTADTIPCELAKPTRTSPPRKRRLGAYIARVDGMSSRPRARARLERRRSWPSMRVTRRRGMEADKAKSKRVLVVPSDRTRPAFDVPDAIVTNATITPHVGNTILYIE